MNSRLTMWQESACRGNFGSLYTLRNDRRVIAANRQLLDSNRDVFLFNTRLQATQQGSAVESVRRQMADDDEIIRFGEPVSARPRKPKWPMVP